MAQDEALTLDGLALHSGGLTLEGFDAPVPKKRHEWVQAADSDGSALVRDPKFENRDVTVRVRIDQTATMDLALAKITAITDKLEEAEKHEGGLAMVWTPADSTKTGTFYVLSGEVEEMPITQSGDGAGWFQRNPVLTLKLTCRPFIYGAEVTGTPVTTTDPLGTVTVTNPGGDVPAEARLIVTDNATQNRRHVEWGLESRFYNAATSLILDSDSMTPLAGSQTTRTGAYDPNATGNNVIRTTVYEETTECCSTGNLSHVGTFRVKARVWAADSEIKLRLSYQSGDGPFQALAYATPPAINDFAEVDLGLIHIPEKILGTQRWSGKIEAYGPAAGATLDVDTLYFIPAAEGYGKARAGDLPSGKGSLQGFDKFTGITAGTVLNARVAPLGGTWATSGATTDFAAADAPLATEETMARSTVSDGSARLAILGATNYTNMRVEVVTRVTVKAITELGVVARYVDASNFLYATIVHYPTWQLRIHKVVAGADTTLASTPISIGAGVWYQVVFTVYASGTMIAEAQDDYSTTLYSVSAFDSVAAAGALASGKPGLRDKNATTTATTRYYDDFWVHNPPTERIAIHSGQSIEFRHDKTEREDSTGTYWGDPPVYRGSPFLLPEGGDESRPARVTAKARRNDVDVASDPNIADSTTYQVNLTPRYLAVPG
jgi:hypothetical protein